MSNPLWVHQPQRLSDDGYIKGERVYGSDISVSYSTNLKYEYFLERMTVHYVWYQAEGILLAGLEYIILLFS